MISISRCSIQIPCHHKSHRIVAIQWSGFTGAIQIALCYTDGTSRRRLKILPCGSTTVTKLICLLAAMGFFAGHCRMRHPAPAGRAEGRLARSGRISGQGGGLAAPRRPDEAAAAKQVRYAHQERPAGVPVFGSGRLQLRLLRDAAELGRISATTRCSPYGKEEVSAAESQAEWDFGAWGW